MEKNYTGTGFFLQIHNFGFHRPLSFPSAPYYTTYVLGHVTVAADGVITHSSSGHVRTYMGTILTLPEGKDQSYPMNINNRAF